MSRVTPILICVAFVSSPVASAPAVPPPPPPDYDAIQFEVKLRGEPVSAWTLNKDGSGVWIDTERPEGVPFGEYTRVYHAIESDVQHYVAIEALLRRLPDPAPSHKGCKKFIHDAAYGTIRMTRDPTTIEIAWNSGCFDEQYLEFLGVLKQADQLVRGWGNSGEVMRREVVSQ